MTRDAGTEPVRISSVPGDSLSSGQRNAVKALCDEAYEMDFTSFLESFVDSIHVLAWEKDRLVGHALWVTRWLQVDDGPLLRTAYVEAVATALGARRRGLAARVMETLVEAVQDYDIAALSPYDHAYYARLGWVLWRGPLFERSEERLVASPDDEEVMIYRLPSTPELDLHRRLSIEWRELEVW